MGNHRLFFIVFCVLGSCFTLAVLGAIILGYMTAENQRAMLSCLAFALFVALGSAFGLWKSKGKQPK